MSTVDLGESLVGAYMRHIEKCPIVLYNSFLDEKQGEVDVVAVKPHGSGGGRVVYLCEATTHIRGMSTVAVGKVPAKLERVREFADLTFPNEEHRFQWWSPHVAEGAATTAFERLKSSWESKGRSLEFVINAGYTQRIHELIEHARKNTATTNEPAYRMLQMLTRLRGEKPKL